MGGIDFVLGISLSLECKNVSSQGVTSDLTPGSALPQTMFNDKKGQDESKSLFGGKRRRSRLDQKCARTGRHPGETEIMAACEVGVLAGFLLL